MAAELYAFPCAIPAATPITAPVTIALTMPPRILRRLDWRVPPGPSGVMGFAVAVANTPIIPTNRGAWIVTDDEAGTWDLADYPTSGAWQFQGYNTGSQPHTVYLRFHADLITDTSQVAVSAPLPFSAIALAATTLPPITPAGVQ